MRNLSFIVLFLLTLFFIHHLVDASLLVKSLPGFEGPLPFELETGYVSIGESGDVELFYYFVKSERNPENDPLMIWLTGGPGCSSICGLLFANGPLAFKGDEYNGTVPPLELTSFSWTKVANILYLEAPAGSGYSYAKTRRAFESSDTKQMHQIDQFLRSWFVKHPEFISNPFYVGGDSYSGKIVPGAVQQISLGNEKGLTPLINIQGYVLGNPVTDKNIETNYRVPFAHGMGLISDELFESLERSCGGKFFNVDPSNARCSNNLQAYDHCMSEIYSEHILLRNCKVDYVLADTPNIRTDRRRVMKEFSVNDSSSLPPPSCFTYRYFLSAFWANDENVRRALGVKKEVGKWNRCNSQNIPYTFEIFNAVPYHVNNSLKGFRSLIYSGDHDSMVPFSSTQAWIRALNYSIVDDWRPWMMSSNQVAGYTRTYANKMTFATIKGGGHTAEYTPDQCSLMFRRWIDGEPL
ncbi:serine carboxypeptidase-like 19 [Arabidopsis thaliana]|uniref:Serine carboxypeptidase-like 19 n=1 Tax=Arabidopsis thaliana TaxID=3702 RepID=SCP19_ARATH|nr:serine carboxypeptidase-like 19 [Arabidopsis thaliana]Q8VZU3.1 RecName: Full=Serine carboxypeptidase-like 19; AltName: Full=Protein SINAPOYLGLUCOSE ACCUMULATOR 2; AltName: Full=Sinapoylglucose--choline O-sinapoyltransferase; Short=SCT; Contains: RecName: Full=Serine carboxypeptidase-like 19 chain A; Contains: RecName: Full=Serine carboxypeptidase-like 19 chain B; Flags: Precursor [Arabidopsis thaliana]AAL36189.1 putative carboxypeptidase [Arabidopsis thaliana]AAM14248.1 putative carboxypeptid|eukprot:NP_568215.2 serine carboxypeptidase-like 19 [Arabidopsis thaliana]